MGDIDLAPPDDGRNETQLERADRNLVELLQEVRVVQTGVQVLFAFLLTAPLSQRFPQLTAFQRHVYFGTLVAAGAAAMLLIAPTAYHRVLFRCGDKEHLVTVANRFTIAGLAAVGVAMVGALLFTTDVLFSDTVTFATAGLAAAVCVWAWVVAPLRRRARLRDEAARTGACPAPLADPPPVAGSRHGPAHHATLQSGSRREPPAAA